jgi:hypothetical protein
MRLLLAALISVLMAPLPAAASTVQLVSFTLTFDAVFRGDSVSRGEALPEWEGPQVFEGLRRGTVISGAFTYTGQLIDGEITCVTGSVCTSSVSFRGKCSATDLVSIYGYVPGRSASVILSDIYHCGDEMLTFSYEGRKGELRFMGYPDTNYATPGSYEAFFKLKNVRENGVLLKGPAEVPLPASGLLLAAATIGTAAWRRRARQA